MATQSLIDLGIGREKDAAFSGGKAKQAAVRASRRAIGQRVEEADEFELRSTDALRNGDDGGECSIYLARAPREEAIGEHLNRIEPFVTGPPPMDARLCRVILA